MIILLLVLKTSSLRFAMPNMQWWRDVTPDFTKNIWKEASDWYEKNEKGNFVKKK